jgi:hypothetical protein
MQNTHMIFDHSHEKEFFIDTGRCTYIYIRFVHLNKDK